MTTKPLSNAFGQFLYFIDGRETVPEIVRAPVHIPRPVAHEPVGGVNSPPAADRQPYYEAGWWAA